MIPTAYYRSVRRNPYIAGYWRMNDASGSTRARDWANRYELNGIYNGSPALSVPLIKADTAAGSRQMGGTGQSLEIANAEQIGSLLFFEEGCSIEMWIVPYEEEQSACLVGKMNVAVTKANPYYIGLEAGKLIFTVGNGTSERTVKAVNKVPVGVPTYVCASFYYKPRKIVLLENTALAELEETIVGEDAGQNVFIGNKSNNTSRFNGLISEVAIYAGTLPIAVSNEHFNIGSQILPEPARFTNYDPPSVS